MYLKFEGSGSTTIEVGCYGFKETFYLVVEETILWGFFEDSQKVIISSSLFLMLIITILLVIMIQRSRSEYEEYEEEPLLPIIPRINPNFNTNIPLIPPLPVAPLPLPPLPLPQAVQTPPTQAVVPQQIATPKVETKEEKLGNAMNLLGQTKLEAEPEKVVETESKIIEDDDLSWI